MRYNPSQLALASDEFVGHHGLKRKRGEEGWGIPMLTLEYILKIGNLEDNVGEPRPGFLHDEVAGFGGQVKMRKGKLMRQRKAVSEKESPQRTMHLGYRIDDKTNERRIVRIDGPKESE